MKHSAAEIKKAWRGCRSAGESATIQNGVVRVLVIPDEDTETVSVYFPGTGEGLGNIFAKVAAWALNGFYPSIGGMHAGFFAGVASIYIPLRKELAKYKPRHVKLFGYSQGGAYAQICALKLRRFMRVKVSLMTFASPKPFRLWFFPMLEGVNFVNGNDLVARVPFFWMLFKSGISRISIGKKRLLPSIGDHYPDKYEKAITQLKDKE